MAKKEVRPFYEVKNEYDESMKVYSMAAMMLHASAVNVLDLAPDCKTEAQLRSLIESMREHVEAYKKAAHG